MLNRKPNKLTVKSRNNLEQSPKHRIIYIEINRIKTTTNFYFLLTFFQIVLNYFLLDYPYVEDNGFFIKMKNFNIF